MGHFRDGIDFKTDLAEDKLYIGKGRRDKDGRRQIFI